MRWSEQEYEDYKRRRDGSHAPRVTPLPHVPTPGMNKTEAAYSRLLELRQRAGEIRAYKFESVKLRLAKRTHYTPDFLVVLPDGTVEFHEVKGFWRDDARVKIKVAAEAYPYFHFVAVQNKKGTWVYEHFRPVIF